MMSNTGPVVALGTFDGVHLGHASMLQAARQLAGPRGTVVAATFDPHPRAVVRGGAPDLLCTMQERVGLLHAAGANRVETIPFTTELAQLQPEEFVDHWLVGRLGAGGVVVGSNFRFGHRAAGDVAMLRVLGAARGFQVETCELLELAGEPVSSSRIRIALAGGDVERATRMLARPYHLRSEVETGARRGRELGMRTANLAWVPGLVVPKDGVYGGVATLDGEAWASAISVGTNPQFTADEPDAPRHVEAHLIGYEGEEFYGADLEVAFEQRIRGQRTFDSVEELVARMREDLVEVAHGLRTRHGSELLGV